MIEIINITRQTYGEVLDAIEREAKADQRKSNTETATVLIMEAVANREHRRKKDVNTNAL